MTTCMQADQNRPALGFRKLKQQPIFQQVYQWYIA